MINDFTKEEITKNLLYYKNNGNPILINISKKKNSFLFKVVKYLYNSCKDEACSNFYMT